MPINKDKKVRKYRGSHTHGGGSKKKRRGAGNRGGRGMAGSGKRADQKKPTIMKKYGNSYFGKRGFKSKNKKLKSINLSNLEQRLPYLIDQKKVTKEEDFYVVNLKSLGYDKILGTGQIKSKFKITSKKYSKNAQEKIEKIGGTITKEDGSPR